jgi:hypothetical protein
LRLKEHTGKILASVLVFAAAVLIFTRFDYLVNADLYNYGLQKDFNGWYFLYSGLYVLAYQIVILPLHWFHQDWRLTVVLEVFVFTAGQDLVFFGLWNYGVFPSGQWEWMAYYYILGFWTTPIQIAFSVGFTALAVLAVSRYKLS